MSDQTPPLKICMTGFSHDPLQPSHKASIEQLGCRTADQLSIDVDYLIINHTCTQKYKIAQLSNSKIECITVKWLEDSVRRGRVLPVDGYRVESMFYGVRAVVEGFEDGGVLERVVGLLRGGGVEEVRVGLGLGERERQRGQDKVDLFKYQVIIVGSIRHYHKLQLKSQQYLSIPIVTTQWLQQSLKSKKCKFPTDYALNYQKITPRPFDDSSNYRRLTKKLQNLMQHDFLNPDNSGLLSDPKTGQPFIVYLDPGTIDAGFADLLRKIVCVSGGVYLDVYGPVVTHVLVGDVQEGEYYKFMNYGDSGYVIRVEWLIDSVLCCEKLPEIDFKVRSFKPTLSKSINSFELKQVYFQRFQQNSQNYIPSLDHRMSSNNFASLQILPKPDKKPKILSISVSQQQAKPAKVVPVTKINKKTQIFKGRYFFMSKNQRKQAIMQAIFGKIRENGGVNISESSIPQMKNKSVYIVLKDSEKNQQYLQQINAIAPNNMIEMIPVSIRWIEQCIKKGHFMQHNLKDYFAFKPFMFQTPSKQFIGMKAQIIGVEEILKRRYKQLLIALGVNRVSPNIGQITHCLCGKSFREDPRYASIVNCLKSSTSSIQKQKQVKQKQTATKQISAPNMFGYILNNKIKFVKIEWVNEWMKNGGKIPIQEFIIPDALNQVNTTE